MAQKSSIWRKIDDPEILGQIRPKIYAPEKNQNQDLVKNK